MLISIKINKEINIKIYKLEKLNENDTILTISYSRILLNITLQILC